MPPALDSKESSFLLSALTRENRFQPLEEVRSWLRERQQAPGYSVREPRFLGHLIRDGNNRWQIDNGGMKVWMLFAQRDCNATRSATDIDNVLRFGKLRILGQVAARRHRHPMDAPQERSKLILRHSCEVYLRLRFVGRYGVRSLQ